MAANDVRLTDIILDEIGTLKAPTFCIIKNAASTQMEMKEFMVAFDTEYMDILIESCRYSRLVLLYFSLVDE